MTATPRKTVYRNSKERAKAYRHLTDARHSLNQVLPWRDEETEFSEYIVKATEQLNHAVSRFLSITEGNRFNDFCSGFNEAKLMVSVLLNFTAPNSKGREKILQIISELDDAKTIILEEWEDDNAK